MTDDDSPRDDAARTDGGATVTSTDVETPIDKLRAFANTELGVVVGVSIGVLLLPFLLIDVLGVLANMTGYGIDGYEGLASLVLIFGIVVVGFNLLLGYVGLLSFGHAAFFGTAAYASALLASEFEVVIPVVGASITMPGLGSPILMVLVGAVIATLLAWGIGFMSIRRSGVYFAVLTLTFGQMLYFFVLAPGDWLTNGDDGFGTGATRFTIDPLLGTVDLGLHAPFLPAEWLYVFIGVITVGAVAIANRIINSPYGLIFEALGQNEERVEFVGLNVFRYKLMSFIISGTFAGVGGVLFAMHEAYIHPNTAMYWITSGDFVIMTILGGVGTLVGPIFGALLFEYISNIFSGFIGSLWRLVLGLAFVVIVWALPGGIYGGLRAGASRVADVVEKAVFDEPEPTPEAEGVDIEDAEKGGDD